MWVKGLVLACRYAYVGSYIGVMVQRFSYGTLVWTPSFRGILTTGPCFEGGQK